MTLKAIETIGHLYVWTSFSEGSGPKPIVVQISEQLRDGREITELPLIAPSKEAALGLMRHVKRLEEDKPDHTFSLIKLKTEDIVIPDSRMVEDGFKGFASAMMEDMPEELKKDLAGVLGELMEKLMNSEGPKKPRSDVH